MKIKNKKIENEIEESNAIFCKRKYVSGKDHQKIRFE